MKQWTMSSARPAYHGRQLAVVVLVQDERQAVVAEQHLPVCIVLALEEACLNRCQQQPLYCILPDVCMECLCSIFLAQHFSWVFSMLSMAGARAIPSSLASSVLDLGPSWSASATPSFTHMNITWLSMKARARCRARCGGGTNRSSKRSRKPQSQVIRTKAHRGGDWDQFLLQDPSVQGQVCDTATNPAASQVHSGRICIVL